jgi:hypothetical protein
MAPRAAPVAAQMPIARPFGSPEKVMPRMARLLGIRTAAPTRCSSREARSTLRVGASAQPSEATANKAVPAISMSRRP